MSMNTVLGPKLAKKLRGIRSRLPCTPNDRMRISLAAGHRSTPSSVRNQIDPESTAWNHLADLLGHE
jgi:hypothetical protein